MTYQNAQFKNTGNDEGDILNFFNNHLRTLVQKNGGDNTFSVVEELCHDKDETIPIGTKTKIRLTHSGHTISQIEKSFLRLIVDLNLSMNKTITAGTFKGKDWEKLNLIFVGFKDAVEIISELQFWVDGKLISGYHQSEMVRESFAYNSIRPKDSKYNSAHSHSLWESVCCMSPNVAGVYIPMSAFEGNNKKVQVKMELVIPFTDQLALQAWRLYPNRILGEVEEEIKFTLDGLVWCQVPPKNVAEAIKFWTSANNGELAAPDLPITNHFVQINQEALIVSKVYQCAFAKFKANDTDENRLPNNAYYCASSVHDATGVAQWNKYEIDLNTLEVNVNECKIEKCRTNCAGFGVKPDVIEALMTTLQEPIIIPSQELTRYQFESRISDQRIDISKSIPLKNATNITLMFPSKPNDLTVYQNPMFTQFRLSVNKKKYPETEFDNSWDGRFVQYQLMANELDGYIEPTVEYLESISRPLNHVSESIPIIAKHERYFMCPFDNTSFGINFQLERGNSGYVFDGVDTGNQAVSIEFRGNLIEVDEKCRYLYPYYKNNAGTIQVNTDAGSKVSPIPEMWICSDTYWTWSIQDGVQYYPRGRPTGYD